MWGQVVAGPERCRESGCPGQTPPSGPLEHLWKQALLNELKHTHTCARVNDYTPCSKYCTCEVHFEINHSRQTLWLTLVISCPADITLAYTHPQCLCHITVAIFLSSISLLQNIEQLRVSVEFKGRCTHNAFWKEMVHYFIWWKIVKWANLHGETPLCTNS